MHNEIYYKELAPTITEAERVCGSPSANWRSTKAVMFFKGLRTRSEGGRRVGFCLRQSDREGLQPLASCALRGPSAARASPTHPHGHSRLPYAVHQLQCPSPREYPQRTHSRIGWCLLGYLTQSNWHMKLTTTNSTKKRKLMNFLSSSTFENSFGRVEFWSESFVKMENSNIWWI